MPLKVTNPLKIVSDTVLLSALAQAGIDKDYVEFYQDYAMPAIVDGKKEKGKSPYAKFYRDLKSNKGFMVVSGLPMVDADGNKNVAGWDDNGSLTNPRYTEKNNLFKASVDGTKVVIQVKNDLPDGRKQGDKLTYKAQLFLDELGVLPASTDATRLLVDPVNSNYTNNVLEWDYGICKRRLRIIEGSLLGSWVFANKPKGIVRVKYNQSGDYKLRLGQFRISDDEELISQLIFNEAEYPFEIGDSTTFYPDPHDETTSVDGYVQATGLDVAWAAIVGHAGTGFVDNGTNTSAVNFKASTTNNQWAEMYRFIFLFDTSSLGANAVISAAVLSLRGRNKLDSLSVTPDVNIYATAPASNIALEAGDFDSFGDTAFATTITYANWDITDYNDFTFNATGRAAISKTGVSKFGSRNANYDVTGTPPNWTTGASSYLLSYASEQGAGYKPKLVVTYTTATTWEGSATLTGVGTLAGIGVGTFIGQSTLSGIGNLAGIGRLIATGKATLTGVGTLSGIGRGIFIGKSTLSGTGTLSGIGRCIFIGITTLSGVGTLIVSALSTFGKRRYGNNFPDETEIRTTKPTGSGRYG